jgi:hypothetical protein
VFAIGRIVDRIPTTSWGDQIDALVASYRHTQLAEIEVRLAIGAWKVNGDDWNDVAARSSLHWHAVGNGQR